MKEDELLLHRLKRYVQTDVYPFHMPGHKRRAYLQDEAEQTCFEKNRRFPDPFWIDITEISGFDNLHYAQGLLAESMDWAAGVYGADRTWYLVNGSTCGILSALCGATKRGDHILMARNCHSSAYHALSLNALRVTYLYPGIVEEIGIQGGICVREVEECLKKYKDISAVFIVSPTYDGIVSDIFSIAHLAHEAGIPLIVDEAHGAHFRFGKDFPVSALDLGADVVIQSVHKTLPGLTQTALLHIKCNGPDGSCYVDIEKIEHYLRVFQSSSPSYVLLASIEQSIFQMEVWSREENLTENREKPTRYQSYIRALNRLRKNLKKMKVLKAAGEELKGKNGIYDVDPSKILVSTFLSPLNGPDLFARLRDEYHLELEMCGPGYVCALTSLCDGSEGFERLSWALLSIDAGLAAEIPKKDTSLSLKILSDADFRAQVILTIFEAESRKKDRVLLKESVGKISAEYVYLYPPGIPFIAPGERITKNLIHAIQQYIKASLPVQGLSDKTLNTILVVH